MQRTAGVCSSRTLSLPRSLSLYPSAISPRGKDLIQEALSGRSFFVLSHSPRSGEHGLPYSAATASDQLKQMTSTRVSSGSSLPSSSLITPATSGSSLAAARLLITTVSCRLSASSGDRRTFDLVSIVIAEHSSRFASAY